MTAGRTFFYKLAGVAASAFVFIACSCGRNTQAANATATAAEEAAIVPVAKVIRTDLASAITLTGEFIPYQQVDVMAKVAGYVRSIKVDIGDRVKQGQVLASLEVPEMRDDMTKASASVDEAQAEVATAREDIARAKSTHEMAHLSFTRIQDVIRKEPGLVPQQEVDEIHSKDLVAEAELAAAESKLHTAERKVAVSQAEKARSGTLENYTTISAPFSGVVTRRYANTGSMVQAGTASQTQAMPVVQVSQNDVLRLMLPVPESAVPTIHVGQTVDVTVATLRQTFPGRVTRFAGQVDMATRTMETEVDVLNPKLILIPGMYAEVKLQLEQGRGVLAAPLGAIDESSGSPRVFAVRQGSISILPVTVGIRTPELEEIRSGSAEGDLLVVGRQAGLQNGEPVQPKLVTTTHTQGS